MNIPYESSKERSPPDFWIECETLPEFRQFSKVNGPYTNAASYKGDF